MITIVASAMESPAAQSHGGFNAGLALVGIILFLIIRGIGKDK